MANKNENASPKAAADSSDRVQIDTYDRGIIPAETAARKEREGESFKQLPDEGFESSTDELAATGGYTVDKEGLANVYAIEPEMYYEEPGDAKEAAAEEKEMRIQELIEINQDKKGDLTMEGDNRGKGTGVI